MADLELKARRRSDYTFHLEYRTRWSDNDMYDHMNNSVYSFLFDSVINAYLIEHCGLQPPTSTQIGLVVHSHCDFFGSVAFPSVVDLALRVNKLGKASVTYEVGIFGRDTEDVRAVGSFTHVFVDREKNRPAVEESPQYLVMATQTNPVSPIVGQKHKLDDKQDEVFNRGKRTISTSHFDIDIQRSDDSQRHGTLEASSNGHKDTEIKRLNLLLIEIEAKAITLANLVNVPTNTTIEQLPALIQSITKHLKFNIVPSTANTENCAAMDYAAGHGSEAFEESDKVIQKDSHEKNQVIEELPGSDSGSKGLGSDGEETIDKNDRCDEEDQETENADRDTDDDINSLWSNSKQEDLSSQAGSNLSLVYHGGHNKGRGGPRSTRKYAKRLARVKNARGGNPVRFQIYHQKQILLSPEPEPEE